MSETTNRDITATLKFGIRHLVAVLFIINSIGLLVHSIGSGFALLLAGLLLIERVQSRLETQIGTELSTIQFLAIIAILYFSSAIFLFNAVDVASEAPDILVPYD